MIYVWIRATVNWEDEQAFLAQLDPSFKPKVDLWNATFNTPFHLFRHRVREIARLNHSRIEGAILASWAEIPEGALVVPVDDDDWLSPDLGDVLEEEYDPDLTGYYWVRTFFEVPFDLGHRLGLIRRSLLPRTPPRYFATTNNYALLKSPETRLLLESHIDASRWFEGQGAERAKGIERHLSAMNRTLASQTSLTKRRLRPVDRSVLIRKFHRYRRLYRDLAREPDPVRLRWRRRSGPVWGRPRAPELAWCRPYLAMMADLMEELTPRDP